MPNTALLPTRRRSAEAGVRAKGGVEEYHALGEAERERVSRNPLTPDDIEALISTAIQLHARALEQQKEKRWWLPLALAVIGFAGAIIGGLLKGQDLALEPRRYAPYPP